MYIPISTFFKSNNHHDSNSNDDDTYQLVATVYTASTVLGALWALIHLMAKQFLGATYYKHSHLATKEIGIREMN